MDRYEALHILATELELFRAKPYSELIQMIGPHPYTAERTGSSGTRYYLEIEAFWDDRPGNNVRILGAIDDGGRSAYSPLCDSFIKSPSNEFIGEQDGIESDDGGAVPGCVEIRDECGFSVGHFEVPPGASSLQGAVMQGAMLDGVRLAGLDMEGADLYWASLDRANLEGANLRNANLRGAFLPFANLRNANLENADLGRDNLDGSSTLEGANLEGACLVGTKLEGATYNRSTKFPTGFNPKQAGMVKTIDPYVQFPARDASGASPNARLRERPSHERKRRAREIQRDIAKTLLREWDPLGIANERIMQDEYDAYVGRVYRLLALGASAREMAALLRDIELRDMGVRGRSVEDLLPIGELLIKLDIRLRR